MFNSKEIYEPLYDELFKLVAAPPKTIFKEKETELYAKMKKTAERYVKLGGVFRFIYASPSLQKFFSDTRISEDDKRPNITVLLEEITKAMVGMSEPKVKVFGRKTEWSSVPGIEASQPVGTRIDTKGMTIQGADVYTRVFAVEPDSIYHYTGKDPFLKQAINHLSLTSAVRPTEQFQLNEGALCHHRLVI